MLAVVLALLGAAPSAIALDPSSTCAPREVLARELTRMGMELRDSAELKLALTSEKDAFMVRLEGKGGALLLTRRLRGGSCDEAGAAAALIVARYVHSLYVAPLPDAPAIPAPAPETSPAPAPQPSTKDSKQRPRPPPAAPSPAPAPSAPPAEHAAPGGLDAPTSIVEL